MTTKVSLRGHKNRLLTTISSAAVIALSTSANAAGVGVDATALQEAVTADNIKTHLEAFQHIADENGGTRDASSEGYLDSVTYVAKAMTLAGYRVSIQMFPYIYFETQSPSEFAQIAPVETVYTLEEVDGFSEATYSGAGDVMTTVEPVDVMLPPGPNANSSSSGCEASDFAGFTAGNIALVQRGACSFFQKAVNAEAAGASGVIIFNEGQEGRTEAFGATLGGVGVSIPVVVTSFDIGNALAATESMVHLKVDAITEVRTTANILADTPIGDPAKTLVVGAHLDSVPGGAGVNDNGSGSGMLLEIAQQMSNLGMLDSEETGIRNRVRFAWWGAEEAGLLGSEYYVYTLPDDDFEEIVANLNFDMVASPNYARFVYDGDGSASDQAGPEGSAFIEWLFNDYFMDQGLPTVPTAFDGRSDYGPFIENGIPAGGLFTGAEGIKTAEEAGLFGGTPDEAYDVCYHKACDTIENINMQGLDEMADAAAYAVNVLAVNDLPVPMARMRQRSAFVASDSTVNMDFRGPHLRQ